MKYHDRSILYPLAEIINTSVQELGGWGVDGSLDVATFIVIVTHINYSQLISLEVMR